MSTESRRRSSALESIVTESKDGQRAGRLALVVKTCTFECGSVNRRQTGQLTETLMLLILIRCRTDHPKNGHRADRTGTQILPTVDLQGDNPQPRRSRQHEPSFDPPPSCSGRSGKPRLPPLVRRSCGTERKAMERNRRRQRGARRGHSCHALTGAVRPEGHLETCGRHWCCPLL